MRPHHPLHLFQHLPRHQKLALSRPLIFLQLDPSPLQGSRLEHSLEILPVLVLVLEDVLIEELIEVLFHDLVLYLDFLGVVVQVVQGGFDLLAQVFLGLAALFEDFSGADEHLFGFFGEARW